MNQSVDPVVAERLDVHRFGLALLLVNVGVILAMSLVVVLMNDADRLGDESAMVSGMSLESVRVQAVSSQNYPVEVTGNIG